MKRVCVEAGCPEIQDETRCPAHRRQREQRRGSSTARGYGYDHQQERAAWQSRLDAGEVITCRRAPFGTCRAPSPIIDRDPNSWDLGHPDAECPAPTAPEHRGPCNRAAPRHITTRIGTQGEGPTHAQL